MNTETQFDFDLVLAQINFEKLPIRRYIPTVPFRLCPVHFAVSTDYENLVRNIKQILKEMNITYSYPDYGSIFFVSSHPSDPDYNCEIRIYAEQCVPDKFIVEIYRYGGDGFLTFDIYDKIYYQYYPEEKNDAISIGFTTGEFDGVPLDCTAYDDLV